MVLSVRVPASVGVSTTCTATAHGVCVAPCPVLTNCGHESPPTSPTSSSVTTVAIAIAIAIAVWSAAIRRVGERARRAPISSKTSTKLHVRFVRMCGGGGSVPGRVYIVVRECVVEEGGGVVGEGQRHGRMAIRSQCTLLGC